MNVLPAAHSCYWHKETVCCFSSGELLQIAVHCLQQLLELALLLGTHARHRQCGQLLALALHIQVHGLRSLALANNISATSTAERVQALVAAGRLPEKLANDLIDSLHFFMGLKLKAGLAELDTDRAVTGAIDVDKLSSLDRDLLKDTLGVVKRFKALLRQRFHLEAA